MSSALVELGPSAVDVAPGTSPREPKPLTPDEVKSVLESEIRASTYSVGSDRSVRRERALREYHGYPYGNEVEGRSKVVLTDIAETIEWILPSLIRMFLGGPLVVEYKASGPGQEEAAKEATEWVNQDFWENQDGLLLFYSWFKDALLQQNGFATVFAEELTEPKRMKFEGLTEQGLALLLLNPALRPVAFGERESAQGPLYDIIVQENYYDCRICCEGVAPEEIMLAERATKLDDRIPFAGRRRLVTRGYLLSLGYEFNLVMNLPAEKSAIAFNSERDIRARSQGHSSLTDVERADPASQEVWLNDCYIRIDEDGDGYAELRHIVSVGDAAQIILEDEEANHVPLVTITPTPMPHALFGVSVADQLSDLQIIRTTLLRQMLDNIYLTNSPRMGVVEGEVEIDDLLTVRPGGVVRMKAPGMVEPIVMQPLSTGVFNLMEWLEQVKEGRVGASKWTQGLDASALNSTATGITSLLSAAQARIELIARLFAGGVRKFFRLYLQTLVESPVKKKLLQLSGAWQEVDPRAWSDTMAVKVEVGLGTGQAAERMTFLRSVLEIQAGIAQNGLTNVVSPDNVYNAASRMTEAMGFRERDLFFTDPQGQPPPPPPPNEKLYESDRRAKDNAADRELEALKLQKDMADAVNDNEFARIELREKMRLEREKIASEERIAMRKIELDAEVARRQASEKKKEKARGNAG